MNRIHSLITVFAVLAILVGGLIVFKPVTSNSQSVETGPTEEVTTTVAPTTTVDLDAFAVAYTAHQLTEFGRIEDERKAAETAAASKKAADKALASKKVAPKASAGVPVASGDVWAKLGQCEAGGDPTIHTANGYSGLYQFADASWRGYGGLEFAPVAWQASASEQTVVAKRIVDSQGGSFRHAFPGCSAKLGLP
jgi:hypothetical protein